MRFLLIFILVLIALFCCYVTPVFSLDVTLQWDANTESDLVGYNIYYDTDSGHPYTGSGAQQGASPIEIDLDDDENPDPDVVEYTIYGLPDGTYYYFAVTAYDNEAPPLESGYSNEVDTTPDTSPPYTTNHSPVPGATRVSVNALITLEVRDAGEGVDQDTITMWVDGSQVSPSISGTPAAYTLSYDPPVDFPYGWSVSVEVDASDLNGNAMATDSYSFTTASGPDTFPPYTTNHNPVPGATGVPVNTLIRLEVRDAEVGVDRSTITMRVNGSQVSPSISGSSAAYRLSYDPPVDFPYNRRVSVKIDASDLNGNAMATYSYSFTTGDNQSGSPITAEEGATGGGSGGCFIDTGASSLNMGSGKYSEERPLILLLMFTLIAVGHIVTMRTRKGAV